MYSYLSRRQFLTAAALGALSGALKLGPSRAQAQTAGSGVIQLVAGRRTIEVNGKPASVFGLRQPSGIHAQKNAVDRGSLVMCEYCSLVFRDLADT